MRVLFLANANSVHTVRWVNKLYDKGIDITLVSNGNDRDEKNAINVAVKIIYLKYSGNIGYFKNAGELKRIWNTGNFDLCNAHYASGYGTLARLAKIKPLILSVWGSDVYAFPYKNLFNKMLVKRNLKYANKILSTSVCMASEVKKLMKQELDIGITPFGVDIAIFFPNPKQHKSFNIGIIKTLKPNYGIQNLIEAFALFLEDKSSKEREVMNLLIYGEGDMKEELVNLVKKKGLESNVKFEGYIRNEEVPNVLNELDLFCLSSINESFGVAAVEAMACSIPVIATDAEGFAEVIENGKSGVIVPKQNVEEMARAIELLYHNKDLRNQYGLEGLKRAQGLYDFDKNADTMIAFYQTLLDDIY